MNYKKILLALPLIISIVFACIYYSQISDSSKNEPPKTCGLECKDEQKECKEVEYNNIDLKEIRKIFESKKDAIILIGFKTCPWCVEIEPILHEVVKDAGKIELLHYLNTRPDGVRENDIRKLQEDEDYLFFYERIKGFLEADGVLYAPTTVFIKAGEVKAIHVGTVPSHDATQDCMAEDEIKELKNILNNNIETYY